MRLCLVSSILTFFISIRFQSEQVLGLSLLIVLLLVGHFHSWKIRLFAVVCIIATGCYSHAWLSERLASRLPASLSGSLVDGVADVIGCNNANPEVERLLLRVRSFQFSNKIKNTNQVFPQLKQLALNYYRHDKKPGFEANAISCGSQIKFQAKLRAPYGFLNPYGFDYEAWQLSRQVDATGYLLGYDVLEQNLDWQTRLLMLRQGWIQRAANLAGISGDIVPALLFGESGYLAKDRWLDFQLTGTIHLLVVSGLHIAILILIVASFWRLIVRLEVLLTFPRRSMLLSFTPLILLLACLLYAYMAGMGLAIQRAGLMLALALWASYQRYQRSLLDTWLWVVWLVLVINPMAILFIGFWFSFAAVGALLMSYCGRLSKPKTARIRRWAKVGVLYQSQWVVFIALMPFLWQFQQAQSILSLLVNIIAIPLLALLIMPLAIVSFIWPQGMGVDMLNSLLLMAMDALHQIALLPSWRVYKPAGLWLLSLFPLVFMALWIPGGPFKRLSTLLIVMIFFTPLTKLDEKLIVFDVGQGLSIYGNSSIEEGGGLGAAWLYDVGASFRSGFSLGDMVVASNLLGFAGKDLSLLFVSHSDNDHAGGEEGLRRKIIPSLTYAGQPRMEHHKDCHQLQGWHPLGAGEDRWRILSYPGNKANDNNHSCILQVDIAGKRILMPGDIDLRAEKLLVRVYGKRLKSDVLILAHHGSKSSSSEVWLDVVDPKLGVVSSGLNNRFQHPHQDVINRFKQRYIPLYNTATSGAVEVDLSKTSSVIQWRKKNPPIWRQM